MKLGQILYSQGFGTRRVCSGLVRAGLVSLGPRVLEDINEEFPTDGLVLTVEGKPWPYHASALVMMHKPAGYECSQKPRHHPSVMTLLPAPLRASDATHTMSVRSSDALTRRVDGLRGRGGRGSAAGWRSSAEAKDPGIHGNARRRRSRRP